jgi:predicted nucleotide-binding protein
MRWQIPYVGTAGAVLDAVRRGAVAGSFDPLRGVVEIEWTRGAGGRERRHFTLADNAKRPIMAEQERPTAMRVEAINDVKPNGYLTVDLAEARLSVVAGGADISASRAFAATVAALVSAPDADLEPRPLQHTPAAERADVSNSLLDSQTEASKDPSSAPPERRRPTMFIGSSSEGLRIAQALQAELDYDVETTIWSQGVFGLDEGNLESLVLALGRFDFAVLVLTPDDLVTRRGATGNAPRDNVLFEAGLFMGALGRRRTFLVASRDDELSLPSDLAGITMAQFRGRQDGNLLAAIGPVATNIRVAIESASTQAADEGGQSAAGVSMAQVTSSTVSEAGGLRSAVDAMPHRDASTSAVRANLAEIREDEQEASDDLAPLLANVDQLLLALEALAPTGHLRGDHARLYAAILRRVQVARPNDPMVAALSVPRESAIRDVFLTSISEARTGLGFMRSALMSSP